MKKYKKKEKNLFQQNRYFYHLIGVMIVGLFILICHQMLSFSTSSRVDEIPSSSCQSLRQAKAVRQLTNQQLQSIHSMHNEANLRVYFENICKVRVPDTPSHTEVQNYIYSTMKQFDWFVEKDEFLWNTIVGPKNFANIVAIQNPQATQHLVVACHYDSKLLKDFVGAVDSAIPCAMMLDLARQLTPFLSQESNDVTLEFIFFDGEEAFLEWTDSDSLYGSRHLASKYSSEKYASSCTKMESIDLFILLDLIGANRPVFRDFFTETSNSFKQMHQIEVQAKHLNLLKDQSHLYFQTGTVYGGVADDHLPFLKKGTRVLHLIAYPFPKHWHKVTDDATNLDWKSIHDVHFIVRAFIIQFLNLKV